MNAGGSSSDPHSWNTVLRDLVRLELRRGCQNDAAVGGFAKLALSLVDSATVEKGSAVQNRLVQEARSLLADYEFLEVSRRSERCTVLLALLSGQDQPLPAAARETLPAHERARVSGNGLLDTLEEPVSKLWGIGPRVQETLARLGIVTISDLLQHAPRRYLDLRQPQHISPEVLGQAVFVRARLMSVVQIRRKVLLVKGKARDSSGRVFNLVWFNNRFVASRLVAGHDYDFYGRLENSFDGPQLTQPAFEESGTPAAQLNMNRIVPVYGLTSGLSQKSLRQHVWRALERLPQDGAEYLPADVAARFSLPDLAFSYHALHFPEDEAHAEEARSRFAFDSLFLFELRVLMHRRSEQASTAPRFALPVGTLERYVSSLPFEPTGSQVAAMRDIEDDVQGRRQMHRLLHGDVGSGKTAVAGFAVYAAKAAGYQSAVLSPTEILAQQTGAVLAELLGPVGVRVGVLTGGVARAQRTSVLRELAEGDLDLLVGTHAILEEGVAFARLGLTVVDEQHRFGVAQRLALGTKGEQPHSLVMSATPIPRTLALTIYGDLDISELTEKPAGRTPVTTRMLAPAEREVAYDIVRREVAGGRQAFVVVPAIDAGGEEEDATASVEEMMKSLTASSLKGLRLASLHGRMKATEKDAVMAAFRARDIDVLVSTTVVEVGIDVPNATVMVIEDAERFGLATLHQLRGRVGRGSSASQCILVQGSATPESTQRLQVLVDCDDGFQIADEDLKLRGPGDILGTVQHGFDVPLFGSTGILSYRDLSRLPDIRVAAGQLLEKDPDLTAPEDAELARMLVLRYPPARPAVEEN